MANQYHHICYSQGNFPESSLKERLAKPIPCPLSTLTWVPPRTLLNPLNNISKSFVTVSSLHHLGLLKWENWPENGWLHDWLQISSSGYQAWGSTFQKWVSRSKLQDYVRQTPPQLLSQTYHQLAKEQIAKLPTKMSRATTPWYKARIHNLNHGISPTLPQDSSPTPL